MKELFDYDQEFEELQAMLIAKSDALAPKIIYLQRHYGDLDNPNYNWPGETTWCADQVNSSDVEYIRADLVGITKDRQELTENQKVAYVSHYGELEAENGRLRAELDEARALGGITYQLQDELNAMSLELDHVRPELKGNGWLVVNLGSELIKLHVNVNTNQVAYKVESGEKRHNFDNYQKAVKFLENGD